MKIIKKLAALTLAALLALSFASCGQGGKEAPDGTESVPETEGEIALYEYEETEGGVTITLCRLLAVDLEIPSEIDGKPVVGIADGVFRNIKETESAVIPDSVKYIGASAFEGCTNLKEITVPEGVEAVGERAFRDTPWLEEQTGEFVTVGDRIAIKYGGTDVDVTVPPEIKYLSDAFSSNPDIKTVTISEGTTVIGAHAFSGMRSLEKVVIPASVTKIGDSAFSFCASLKEVTIPETVTELGEFLFSRCSALEKVTIEAKVDILKLGTFANCTALKEAVFPETLTTLENAVFENCPSLEKVNFPASLTDISKGVFDEGATVTVSVEKDSYAEKFCAENSIKTAAYGN